MADVETIKHQQQLLATHRRNLANLLQQVAQYGGAAFAPLHLVSNIEETRSQIRQIQQRLRTMGVQVEDEPLDEYIKTYLEYPDSPKSLRNTSLGVAPKTVTSLRRSRWIMGGMFASITILLSLLGNLAASILEARLSNYSWVIFSLFIAISIITTLMSLRQASKDEPLQTITPALDLRYRTMLISRVHAFWIDGLLRQSLFHEAFINLHLEERSDAVTSPRNVLVQRPNQVIQPLSPHTSIISVFDGLGGSMLILGAPGSGKTTLLLELAQHLLARAQGDESCPIPVVFNLASWSLQRVPLDQWIVSEIHERYYVPTAVAINWVQRDQLLLLLDGLDEVAAEHRGACITAINRFHREHDLVGLVVCSRVVDYEALSKPLALRGAIVVQPLSKEQISQFLHQLGHRIKGLQIALKDNPVFWELLNNPLMLSIMVLAYNDTSASSINGRRPGVEPSQDIFASYTEAMLKRHVPRGEFTQQQYIQWLSWLAYTMLQLSQTAFYVESMQPTWLPTRTQRRMYRLLNILGFGLSIGAIGGLIGWLNSGSTFLTSVLAFTVFGAIIGGSSMEIRLVDRVNFSWRAAQRGLIFGIGGAVIGTFTGLVVDVIAGGGTSGLIIGLVSGLVYGLIYGVVTRLVSQTIVLRTTPNQGIYRSVVNALMTGGSGVFVGSIVYGLIYGLVNSWSNVSVGIVTGGLVGGLTGWLAGGGAAYVKHYMLRLLLMLNNYAPWNYVAFLEEATSRILLRRVGGGYIFVHRLLLEYFASLYVNEAKMTSIDTETTMLAEEEERVRQIRETALLIKSLPALAAFFDEIEWVSEDKEVPILGGTALLLMRDISQEVTGAMLSDSLTNRVRRLTEALRLTQRLLQQRSDFNQVGKRWQVIIEEGLEIAKANQREAEPIPSVYIKDRRPIQPGGRPDNAIPFKGRADLFRQLEDALGGAANERTTLLLYGQRGVGKTSALLQLPRRLGSQFVPVFLDLQDGRLAGAKDATGLLRGLADVVVEQALKHRRVVLPQIDRLSLAEDAYPAFASWLIKVERTLDNRTLLLCLDEFEALEKAISVKRIDTRILDTFRNIMQHRQQIVVLLSGSHHIDELPSYWAGALVTTTKLAISFLSEFDARDLIERPVVDFPDIYRVEAVDEIVRVTRCHPYLIQLLCALLVERMNNLGRRPPESFVEVEDVRAVIPLVLERGSNYFIDLWRTQAGGAISQIVLAELAQAADAYLSRIQLRSLLQNQAELAMAIQTLLRRELIERVDIGGYRIMVPLVADYVRMKTDV